MEWRGKAEKQVLFKKKKQKYIHQHMWEKT